MRTRELLVIAVVCLLVSVAPVQAQETDPHPLMDILALIPDTPEVRAYGVSYMDYAAIISARPGTPEIISWAQFDTLDNSRDGADQDAMGLWIAAMMGITSGPPDLPQTLLIAKDEMTSVVGFNFFDLDRGVTFLPAPGMVTLLQGDFDQEAIAEAFTERSYSAQDLESMTLLCGPDGCDTGAMVDFDTRNPANPFGGNLGRNQPLLMLPGTVISSTSDVLLGNYPAFQEGLFPVLADAPDYRAAVRAISSTGTLIQAHFYDPSLFPPQDPLLALLDPEMTSEEREAAIEELRIQIAADAQDVLPYYSVVTLADIVDGAEQLVLIGLVFENATTAQIAADVLQNRISQYQSTVLRQPLSDMLTERETTIGTPELVGDWETGLVVVIIPFRAPMPPQEPGDSFPKFVQSSMVFRFFINMFYQRDLNWLAIGG